MSSIEATARTAAQQVRGDSPLTPINDLVTFAEKKFGVDVIVAPGNPDEHGLTAKDEKTGRIYTVISATPHPMRWRSTLAHELSHIHFNDWDTLPEDPSHRSPQEIRADAFARHLLLPEESVNQLTQGKAATLEHLSEAVRIFKVSPQLATIVFRSTKLITPEQEQQWKKIRTRSLALRFGWLQDYEDLSHQTNLPRQSKRILTRAIEGYVNGVISLSQLALLHQVTKPEMEKQLAEANIHPYPDLEDDDFDDLITDGGN